MKKILGLDIGSGSIGWAFVNEAENNDPKGLSKIVKLGVRVVPYGDNMVKKDALGNISTSKEPIKDFEKGMALSLNARRTQMRGMRRNLQRYKLRRENLVAILKENGLITDKTALFEATKNSTFETLRLRAKAAEDRIELEEFARVLLMINKKRGYKSSRKAKNEEEGAAIDSMGIAKQLYDHNLSPGEYVVQLIENGKTTIPKFYPSDLRAEFESIWKYQSTHYPEVLNAKVFNDLNNLSRSQTTKYFLNQLQTDSSKLIANPKEKKEVKYRLRAKAIHEKLPLEDLIHVFAEINGDISNSSGYLGAISDRSKELYFKRITVGQYLYEQVANNPHAQLKKQVFYRQDYLDEFEKTWEVQAKAHPLLTKKLKTEIRDTVIFYQRRLKSQKHLITDCELEKYHKAIPKSSPLFQEFRIWHNLLNIRISKTNEGEYALNEEQLNFLRHKLSFKEHISGAELVKELKLEKGWKCNFSKIEGNRTNCKMLSAFLRIVEQEGYELNPDSESLLLDLKAIFSSLNFDTQVLDFDIPFEDEGFDKHPNFQLWHLLYSAEDDRKLKDVLANKYGFNESASAILTNISFESDYGRYSSRAIRKLLPLMQEGNDLSETLALIGYQKIKPEIIEELELLKLGALRNPVVEKVLNQVINLINAILKHPEMGRPDEIRIELARELKKNAEQRRDMTKGIADATANNDRIRKLLSSEFGIQKVSKNDIIRYKLWKECGYVSIYSGEFIPKSELFGNKYDIDHIIPRSKLFDDSYSNKVLCERAWNEEKGNKTAKEFLEVKLSADDFASYLKRIEDLKAKKEGISKTKFLKLSWDSADIPEDFIKRQLQESQYIARKAKEILQQISPKVSTTIGPITDRLRTDWGLVDIMKELNWNKYQSLGLTEEIIDKTGKKHRQIRDWNKRNDHRHHAMDALTVAFTKPSFIQYLNYLNARDRHDQIGKEVFGIQSKELFKDDANKWRFKSPMPCFRNEAKKHLEEILVSRKANNKVVTLNVNKIKIGSGKICKQIIETPRGQLHNETIYGSLKRYKTKLIPINASLDFETILKVANKGHREALLLRLEENGNDPKKAFSGKNSPSKKPILFKGGIETLPSKVKISYLEEEFTIRKEVNPENFKNVKSLEKIIDAGARRALEKRLEESNDAKTAFSNLEENPIWLNEEKRISIKSVKISGVKNAEALHRKRGIDGELILDDQGKEIPTSYVSTGNNHHAAIYEDSEGNLYDEVVSFYEAVQRYKQDKTVVWDPNSLGHPLKFTLKKNEYFVFPAEGFDPQEIDLRDPENYSTISPNLYRVQAVSRLAYGTAIIREYVFRHHLETLVETNKALQNITYKKIKSLEPLKHIVKVRVNYLGEIVQVGEY